MTYPLPFLIVASFLFFAVNAEAQRAKRLSLSIGCCFANGSQPTEVTILDASEEAKTIVDEIVSVNPMRVRPEFVLNAGNVPNAMATEINGVRYIIYSEKFLEEIKTKSLTSWAAKFVLAHEIGHHAYKHDFKNKTEEQSYNDEFDADDFAARVLFHLDATLGETLAGIRTFDDDGNSNTHPDPTAREEVTTKAWMEESKPDTKKKLIFPLSLDTKCFNNRWNLIKEAKSDIDNEKVTINIQIPPKYETRQFLICLKSNDNTIIPESRVPGSVKGTGYNLAYSPNQTIIWNYTMDKVSQEQAGKPGM